MIRRLDERDLERFMALRREALLTAPDAFGSAPERDRFADPDVTRRHLGDDPLAPIFGAFEDEVLVGNVGLFAELHPKRGHKASVWGTWVSPNARGGGHGESLMRALIEYARGLDGVDWLQLDVTATARAALRLYERVGFVSWGLEPDGLRVDGRALDVHHMVLELDPEPTDTTG